MKKEKDKLSRQLLPLIVLLMLVILFTLIVSNLRKEQMQPLSDMRPIPEAPVSSVNEGIVGTEISEIFSKEELIVMSAIKKYRLGEIEEAEKDFRTILVFDPNHQTALSYLGTIFFSQNKYREAELLFRRETEMYSGNPIAYRNLALALLQQERLKESLDMMKKSAEISPDNPEILIALARIYAYSGDLGNTDKYLKRAKANGADLSEILKEDTFKPLKQKMKAEK